MAVSTTSAQPQEADFSFAIYGIFSFLSARELALSAVINRFFAQQARAHIGKISPPLQFAYELVWLHNDLIAQKKLQNCSEIILPLDVDPREGAFQAFDQLFARESDTAKNLFREHFGDPKVVFIPSSLITRIEWLFLLCHRIEHLFFEENAPQLSDIAFSALRKASSLRHLFIPSEMPSVLTDQNVFETISHFEHLENLTISLNMHMAAHVCMKKIAQCSRLRFLSLTSHPDNYSNRFYTFIFNPMPQLEVLRLKGFSNFTNESLESLCDNCPKIRDVRLRRCPNITPTGIESLRKERQEAKRPLKLALR